jgi:hypothetical protein
MAYAAITKPSDNFRTKLYTGNGSARSITFDESGNMQPDLMWIKSRGHAASWLCNDVLRGATYRLKLDMNSAQSNETQMITSFDTNGFSLGTSTTANQNTTDFASYSWKGAGSGSSNSDGSLTSTVSANTTAGCSIVQYAGSSSASTIGHGLGVAPDMIIVKTYSSGYEWAVYHSSLGEGQNLYLDTDGGSSATTTFWNNTAPTNSVFSAGGNVIYTNYAGQNYIAYCFAEKKGYSKFGKYTGNGNANGPFIYTGFKPAWVLTKATSRTGRWRVWDVKRSTFNVADKRLDPSSSDTESTGSTEAIDITSNGFKIRTLEAQFNGSGETNIYMAFAENPLVANVGQSIPATAR